MATTTDKPSLRQRLGVPDAGLWFMGMLFVLTVGLNIAIVTCLPYGAAIEAMLLTWSIFWDKSPHDGRGRPHYLMRQHMCWKACQRYFPISMHQEQDFDPTKRYLFGYFPHGIISVGAWSCFGGNAINFSEKNGNIDVAVATVSANFALPFYREVMLAVGLVDATFSSLLNCLKRNRSVLVVLGGAQEALNAHPGTNNIVLNKRTGFVRMALMTGTPLVPVFAFGENDLFYQVPNPKGSWLRTAQEAFMRAFKFSPPLMMGTGFFNCPIGLAARRRPVHIVIGKAIPVPHIATPTRQDVTTYHAQYRAALEDLYARHQAHYYEHILPPDMRPAVVPKLCVVA